MKKIIAVGLALTASMSAAQQPPAPPPGGSPRPDPAREAAMKARTAEDMALLLDLKPAQRPALDAWLAAAPAFGPPRPPRPGEDPPADRAARPEDMSFLDRLDGMEKQIDAADARRKAGFAAARSFYDQLDAEQKRRFDALEHVRHAPPGGRMMRMPHPGGEPPE